jgi:hypothetical protein
LFSTLKNTAVVGGRFQGFRLDLSGSFAAYFALVFLVIHTRPTWDPTPYEVWHISGQIVDENEEPLKYIDPRFVTVTPPALVPMEGGEFHATVTTSPTAKGDSREYPTLVISFPNYKQSMYYLGPSVLKPPYTNLPTSRDTESGEIQIGRIQLERGGKTPYTP